MGGSIANVNLREEYVGLVKALENEKTRLLKEGKTIEEVAKFLQAERRRLTVEYKHITPDDFLEWIFKRNDITYTQKGKGDKWGATYDGLVKSNAKKMFDIDDVSILNQIQLKEINESIAKTASEVAESTKQALGDNFYNFFKDKIPESELNNLTDILIKYRMR